MKGMTIGQIEQETGVSARMLRHYESIGLLQPLRSDAGYRYYDARLLHEVHFIRQSRELGFSLEQIASLLVLWRDKSRSSAEVKALASQHLDELTHKIGQLQQMQQTLQQLICACQGDERPDCPILEGLAQEKPAHAACHSGAE